MKLNFWQWLGVALIVAGVAYKFACDTTPADKPAQPAPATQPAAS